MALMTDGNPNGTEELRVYEASILSVSHMEEIDLDAKLGLATEEVSQEVLDMLLGHDPAAVGLDGGRRTIGVSDVVVTPQVKRWHALHTLSVVYRDVYHNQLNDRYRMKWEEYRTLSREAREQAMRFGIGLVTTPIPRAGLPSFSVVAGLIAATTYYVRVSWVGANGQEGAGSFPTTYLTVDGSRLVVTPPSAPTVATAWNVYIGLTYDSLILQNAAPISTGVSFTLPAGGLVVGRAPGGGQAPDMYVTGGRLLRRG